MGAPAKYLFDLDFSTPDRSRERGACLDEVARQVAAAEARGYRRGYEAAEREAQLQNERHSTQALTQIGDGIHALAQSFRTVETRLEAEAVGIAVAVARKLAGELLAAEPMTEIVALVGECFRHLVATPHLVVRLGDALYDAGRVELERLAKHSGFQGRLVILAEPDMPGGDCRIEWADGGVVLERGATDARITELVARYMASRNPSGADRP